MPFGTLRIAKRWHTLENMNSNTFLTFQKFSYLEDAILLKQSLEKERIEVLVEDTSASVDITFSGNTFGNEFLLKIQKNDFEKANDILKKQAEQEVLKFSDDHYLYDFSDEELLEVICKFDEWCKEDFILAQKILKSRGHDINRKKVVALKKKRLKEIRKPEKGDYLEPVFLLGFIVDWAHWKSTKIDPSGKRYYVYDEETRRKGKKNFITWVVVTVIIVLVWIIRSLNK
jgi:hypothetical protein